MGGVGGEGEGAEVVDAEVVEGGGGEGVVGGHCVRCGTMLWLHCGGGCEEEESGWGGPSSPIRRVFHRPNLLVNILPIVYSSLSLVLEFWPAGSLSDWHVHGLKETSADGRWPFTTNGKLVQSFRDSWLLATSASRMVCIDLYPVLLSLCSSALRYWL